MGNVIRQKDFVNRKRHVARSQRLAERKTHIPDGYLGDIRLYKKYCDQTDQEYSVESMLDYMDYSLHEQKVKKSTWERRLAAVRKYFSVRHDVNWKTEEEAAEQIKWMRDEFRDEERANQTLIEGKSAVDKEELLDMIRQLPVRPKAVTLTNLITASRPNEMVRLKIEDFDLDGRFVKIYLKKQSKWHYKRLTLEVVKAVRDYIKKYKLKKDDYFVGHVNKGDVYTSRQISEDGYNKALKSWIGLTAYNLRKTQVVSMHEQGADLTTIAKQTGHDSIEVLAKHYLEVSDTTVDKYL